MSNNTQARCIVSLIIGHKQNRLLPIQILPFCKQKSDEIIPAPGLV